MARRRNVDPAADYFPPEAFGEANLARKLSDTFPARDVDAARAIVSRLDAMPVAQPTNVEGLRARAKFDAIWYSRGDLARLEQAVSWGMRDFPTLMAVEVDRNIGDWDSDKFRYWVLN